MRPPETFYLSRKDENFATLACIFAKNILCVCTKDMDVLAHEHDKSISDLLCTPGLENCKHINIWNIFSPLLILDVAT
jgi:hypothetical protein